MKKCEIFACPNRGVQLYQMGPGTNVWLCQRCIHAMEKQVEREAQRELEKVG